MRPRSRRVKLANRFGLQLLNKAATRFSMCVLGPFYSQYRPRVYSHGILRAPGYWYDMDRREFLAAMAAFPALNLQESPPAPNYKIVSSYKPTAQPGMPGPYPGRVVTVHSPQCIDVATEKADTPTVKMMMARGMTTLTGDKDVRDSWARLFNAQDFVGIKVNMVGGPAVVSAPEIVGEIATQLVAVGVKPANIVVYDRGSGRIREAGYEQVIPAGARVESGNTWLGFDPDVYVEATFWEEEDTRSFLLRMITQQFTKIVNVPSMKDHGAAGVTGCLKNVAYGGFNNVDRSHHHAHTDTLTYIGTLCTVEPVRSRTVLNIMDGLRGVWHAGPFSRDKRYRFFPKQIKFGTDPVAIDRFLIDVIDDKRKQEGAISVWERDPKYYSAKLDDWQANPNVNRFIREPGHIEYASKLGLGVYDKSKIRHTEITI